MIHYGDISKLNGCDLPSVDIVCGGSPCQNLSFSGNRLGLQGNESRLFLEQIRLIKEMRDYDSALFVRRRRDEIRPRLMVWENVKGAFSSNSGEDFRRVLEETARIVDAETIIPRPPKGKWTKAGCIMGDGWSIAWRLHDAKFWGVPQSRKRISLVADFGGGGHQRYYLSEKTCRGMIARASKSGKKLPDILKKALDYRLNELSASIL